MITQQTADHISLYGNCVIQHNNNDYIIAQQPRRSRKVRTIRHLGKHCLLDHDERAGVSVLPNNGSVILQNQTGERWIVTKI